MYNLQNSDLGTELRILEPRGSGSSLKWHMWNDSSVCRLRAETIKVKEIELFISSYNQVCDPFLAPNYIIGESKLF